jgi:hypothetical protein
VSLIVAVKCREGVALATDSRVVASHPQLGRSYFTWDGEHKLWDFAPPHGHVGILLVGGTTMERPLEELRADFERALPPRRLSTKEYAERLNVFFHDHPRPMLAAVCGVDEDGTARVWIVNTLEGGPPVEHLVGVNGIAWGGQREFVDRVLLGYDPRMIAALADELEVAQEHREAFGRELAAGFEMPIDIDSLTLQRAAELAWFLVEMTVMLHYFVAGDGPRGVGGPVDTATITAADGLQWRQRKKPSERRPDVDWHENTEIAPPVVEANGIGMATYAAGRSTEAAASAT